MPTSLDALTTLDLALIAAVVILSLVSGGLALRSQVSPQASPSDNRQNHSNTLKALQEQLKTAQAESKDTREEAELTQLQLHQLQEELEQISLADQSKQEQIKNFDAKLKVAQAESKEAREEAELTLLQLHQLQEEIEHYFLLSREQNALLDGHAHQQKRVQKLLNTVLTAQTPSSSSAAEGSA